MTINKIAVIGGGLMGRQIALNAAIYGVEAKVYDLSPEVRENVVAWEKDYLAGRVKKGRMTQEQTDAAADKFSVLSDMKDAVEGVDCVVEAIVEIESVKRELFEQLSQILPEETIIATNSSYMVSSVFAHSVTNPSRLANMHFYNPALVLKLVEIVQGPHTSDATSQALMDFCRRTGKTPILMTKELSGFAGSRITHVIAKEARWMVQNGYITPQDMDLVCENGLKHPMGPFRLNDLTGVDLTYNKMVAEYDKTGVKPDMFDVFAKMVEEGRLGRKTGRGFYDYE